MNRKGHKGHKGKRVSESFWSGCFYFFQNGDAPPVRDWERAVINFLVVVYVNVVVTFCTSSIDNVKAWAICSTVKPICNNLGIASFLACSACSAR